jgi:hypothetical protein
MRFERPEALGDRGRAHHVDEQEEASLGKRAGGTCPARVP